MEKYIVGADTKETETFEAITEIPQNRVLMAEKLTAGTPLKPVIVEDLTNTEQVFAYFKPQIDVEFETEEGSMRKETMRFANLGDFGIKGITNQSSLLKELTLKKEQYQKIIRQLSVNKLLRKALAEKESKENLVSALHALIRELEEA